jgi:hypothetical protein
MIVFNLACEQDHAFEGWFGSADDFESQRQRGLVACPVCMSAQVVKKLHAPRFNLGALAPAVASSSPASASASTAVALPKPTPGDDEQTRMLRALMRHIADNTDDVGTQFAEEARKMHYNEVPVRGIRGVASREEAQALAEEGIEVAQLPFPVVPEKLLN